MATNLDITFRVCELDNCVSQYFVLVCFSSVIYVQGLLLCEDSVGAIRYVLSLLNCHITSEKSEFNLCNILATLW
jgi:hypothetical protein